ncbi:hypothetical protein [Intestinirhabdus alba]|jgi:hypothetical protein|uniref:Uncharacterized protein n=1 Tax=Intestinirhabdus alba TaxID=2899544 RepID=A0A6L6IE42_9ENTR|nr:hypothetical protein [Intestinirhabdus alba]MTH44991.1 hypothetical protein [Intestinirhabdus alba]
MLTQNRTTQVDYGEQEVTGHALLSLGDYQSALAGETAAPSPVNRVDILRSFFRLFCK